MPPERRGSRALQISIGVAVSALLVWLAFRGTRFDVAWAYIRRVDIPLLLLAVTVATLPFALRVPRWRLLLRHSDGSPLHVSALWNSIAIGFAANNVLPLRAGEVLRVAAVHRLSRVSFAAALSSVAVERVLDALTVVALLGVGLLNAHLPGHVEIATNATRIGAVCIVALLLAILATWQRALALGLLRRVTGHGPRRAKLHAFVDHLLRGLGALSDPRRAIPVAFWSLVIWLVNASAFFIAFRAFHLDVPYSGALILQTALMIGIAAPSTPGYAGAFELPIIGVLLLYGIDKDLGLAYAIAYHVTTFVPITLLGAIAAKRSGVHLRSATAESS